MKVTKMGQIIVKNTTGNLIGWCCKFGKRWVSITIHPNGVVCFDNASLSTKLWVMNEARRPLLREHLSDMLRAERSYKQCGFYMKTKGAE